MICFSDRSLSQKLRIPWVFDGFAVKPSEFLGFFNIFHIKPRKPRENQESKNPRFSGRCLVHYKILDSWFSRGFLGFPGFTWEFLDFQQKKQELLSFFGFPAKNQELLWFLDFRQKTKKTSRKPRIQDFQVYVLSTTKSWILGFLEVFLVFLVLRGNSWISSKKPRITEVFLDFQQKTKNYYGFWISSKKPRKPRENQESKILSWAGHLHENLGFLDSWFSRGFLGFLDFTWEFLDIQQKN